MEGQITLNEWVEMKEKIKRELQSMSHSFVRVGYYLRLIEQQEAYKQEGYKSLAEFAQKEYGLSPSAVTRFKKINERFSQDGFSEILLEQYSEMGQSKLGEMLALPDQDMDMVTTDTKRDTIRELKTFNKGAEGEDDFHKVIIEFFRSNKEALNNLFIEENQEASAFEVVCPAGQKAFKHGIYFLNMTESGIKIKQFGGQPREMSWLEFKLTTKGIFEEAAEGPNTYTNYFGEEKTPDTLKTLNETEIAPAQKSEEKQPKKEEKEQNTEEKSTENTEVLPLEEKEEPKKEEKVEETLKTLDEEPIAPAQSEVEQTVEFEQKTEEIEPKTDSEGAENTKEIQENVVEVEKIQEIVVEKTLKPCKNYMRAPQDRLEEVKDWMMGYCGDHDCNLHEEGLEECVEYYNAHYRCVDCKWGIVMKLIDREIEDISNA